MATKNESIKLLNSAIDETPSGDIIFRGVIDPSSLSLVRVDTYQREVLPLSVVSSLVKAIREQRQIPDIVLGMRGQNYSERNGITYLHDETYVIDGLQRISVAMELMRRNGVCDETYAETTAVFGESGTVELAALTGYFVMVCWIMNVARTPGPAAAKVPGLQAFPR